MRSLVLNVTFDCQDAGAVAEFWVDLLPDGSSQEEEVARLLDLGASVVDDRRRSNPGGWVVMADPEGNEFCVEHRPV